MQLQRIQVTYFKRPDDFWRELCENWTLNTINYSDCLRLFHFCFQIALSIHKICAKGVGSMFTLCWCNSYSQKLIHCDMGATLVRLYLNTLIASLSAISYVQYCYSFEIARHLVPNCRFVSTCPSFKFSTLAEAWNEIFHYQHGTDISQSVIEPINGTSVEMRTL